MAARRPSDDMIGILRKLIGFQSVSRNSNLDLIEWVQAYLAGFGIESTLTTGDEGKANIFARIGEGDGGIVLNGHTDVVPVDGQNWSTDPFELVEQDGLFYGRGTSDMKGFIACVLAKVPAMVAARRNEPIYLAFSYDEEVGCAGVGHLLHDIVARGIKPRGCIVGEPTSMNAIVGHKTGSAYIGMVTGREMHSSLAPQGVNALEYAALLILRIREIGKRLEREERRHDGYEVPYSTMLTAVIASGHASNIVPAECTFRFDVRTLPWTDPDALVAEIEAYAREELLPEMRAVAPEADIRIRRKGRVPGFSIDEEAPLTRYVQRLAGSNVRPGYVTFGSEAGLFQQQDIPSVICGPGSISQAHKPDEFVALEQLARCEDFLDRLIATDFV